MSLCVHVRESACVLLFVCSVCDREKKRERDRDTYDMTMQVQLCLLACLSGHRYQNMIIKLKKVNCKQR